MGHVVLAHDKHSDDAQWDPLAPAQYRDAEPHQVIDDAAPAPTDAPVVDEVAEGGATGGGHSDPAGIARVWMTDGRLARVRVSSNWRTKVAEQKVTLSDCINAAIVESSLYVHDLTTPVEHTARDVPDEELIPLASAVEADRLLDDWMRRQEAAVARLQEAPVPDEMPTTRAHSAGATAVLDAHGRLMHVELSEQWLERCDTTAINNNVVAAAASAYREYVPQEQPAREELDQLFREHDVIVASYLAWMNRGDWQ